MSPQRWCQNQSAELIHTRQRQNCFDLQLQGTRVCVNSTCMLLCIPHNAVSQSRPNRGVFVNWGYGSKIIPCRLALIGSDRIVGPWLMAERTQDFPDPHYHQQQSRELHDFLLQQFVGLKCQLWLFKINRAATNHYFHHRLICQLLSKSISRLYYKWQRKAPQPLPSSFSIHQILNLKKNCDKNCDENKEFTISL